MHLDRVTITGADESIHPEALLLLSQAYPFVEWGVLISRSRYASPRFPGLEWRQALQQYATRHPMQLSLHLCGKYVRDILMGIPIHLSLLASFARVQLNFHRDVLGCSPSLFVTALRLLGERQVIFQIDGAGGEAYLQHVLECHELNGPTIDAVALFDVSGGAGILPRDWPAPKYMANDTDLAYHGYAGGLSPDNLQGELERITEAAGESRIWIDVESRVRSEDDRRFDLEKVARFLEIAKPYIRKQA